MMIQKKHAFLFFTVLFLSTVAHGQLTQFTQNNFTHERVNPALLGFMKSSSIKLLHRRQTFLSLDRLVTNYLSLNYTNGKKRSGANFSYVSDQSNTFDFFKTDEFAFSYANSIYLNKNSKLSLGVGINYSKMSLDLSGLTTSNQFVPGRGFNELIQNGEVTNTANLKKSNFNTGLGFQKSDKKGFPLLEAGIAVLNINNVFVNDEPSSSSPNFISHFIRKVNIKEGYWLGGELYLNNIKTDNSIIVGLSLEKAVRIVNRGKSGYEVISFYSRYNSIGYFSFATALRKESYEIGLSYDFYQGANPINNGVEFSLGYYFEPPNRKKRNRRKKRKPSNPIRETSPPTTSDEEEEEENHTIEYIDENTTPDHQAPDSIINESSEYLVEIELDKFYMLSFETASHQLKKQSLVYLNSVKSELLSYKDYIIEIHGHTDNVGSEEDNMVLSIKRAESIKLFLTNSKIEKERIEVIGKGETEPIANNNNLEGRAINRRVEIKLVKKGSTNR